jgi:hypothetical protein
MLFSSWLRNWQRSLDRRSAPSRTRRRRPPACRVARRPCLEALEDRTLLSTFLVTNTGDNGGVNPAVGAGTGTLRQAIVDANAAGTGTATNPDVIQFALPANDPHHFYYKNDGVAGHVSLANVAATTAADDSTISDIDPDWAHSWWSIQPASALPTITDIVVIDGYTQGQNTPQKASQNTLAKGDNAVLRIELNGSNAPLYTNGLLISAGNSTVRGLDINRFLGDSFGGLSGIRLIMNGGNRIQGNFIGTDVSGTIGASGLPDITSPNITTGIMFDGIRVTSGSQNNYIGVADDMNDAAERNLISANFWGVALEGPTSNNVVAGNFIGTDATGSRALPNWGGIGTDLGANNTRIGADATGNDAAGQRNVISASRFGIVLGAGLAAVPGEYNSRVAGNFIGTDVTGSQPLGNYLAGVGVSEGSYSITIGGTTAALANTIANTTNGPGVWLGTFENGAVPTTIRIQGNSIHDNHGLGIDLGGDYPSTGPNGVTLNDSLGHTGPNNYQDFPVLTTAVSSSSDTSITGTFTEAAEPNTTITLDFYANASEDPSGHGQGQTYLGSAQVTTDATGNAPISVDLGTGSLAGQWITATATDSSGNTSEFAADIQATAAPSGQSFNSTYLQSLLPQSSSSSNVLSIQTGPNLTQDTVIAAVNGLTAPSQPVTITLNLSGGNYNDTTVNPPANVTLVINGASGTNTFVGHSPAFTVTGGTVIVRNVRFTTATDAPTIRVTGGSLTLRNDTIQESTGATDAAISITGGSLDLGIASDPGGNTLNVNGAGEFVHNTTANAVSAVGDTFKINGTPSSASSLSFTALTSSAATSPPGQAVKLTAVVRANGSSSTPTGSVDFLDATTNTDLGSATLSGGSATLVTSALTAGNHAIVATYSGDTSFLLSLDTLHLSIPTVGAISAPLAPVAINTTINASASFTDAIASNTHTAVWNWGDGSTSNGTVSESNGAGTVTGSHAYSVDGVYTVTLTVTNNQGGSGQSVFSYVVVYDPSAGFVTGGGWFNSPAGAYPANPTLTGQATFGLNAKYKSGSTVPTGNTDFHFPAANLDFKSTSYDWLVINGNQAQYQGSGTINGSGNYGFLVTALDNDANSGGGVDTIRIEIWDKNNNNAVIYDTQPGAANTAPPTTPLGGGDIQIHTNAQTASVILSTGGSPSSSTVVTDSVLSNMTPTPAASVGGASSNAVGWSAFEMSVLGSIERDISQWEDAMTRELASLIQTVDQLFVELSADIRVRQSTVAPLA